MRRQMPDGSYQKVERGGRAAPRGENLGPAPRPAGASPAGIGRDSYGRKAQRRKALS